MNYCALADLVTRYGQQDVLARTDRDNDGVADAAVADAAIADASALIDSYLAGRYSVPFTSPPPALTRVACDIAWYLLFSDEKAPDQVKTKYDAAIEFLKAIKSGEISLGAGGVGVAAVADLPKYTDPLRVFTRDTMSDY
ncbi:DUF1320 domain-containing protein [candidate division KSB1 bacterium]|nr:DUF1320 domain-containing protein [candidate division KSB1 bacterium]